MAEPNSQEHAQGLKDGKESPISAPNHQPGQGEPTASGADAVLDLIAETGTHGVEIYPEASKRLVRKIDWHIMPLICTIYFLQYIDKTAISYASVTGLPEAANLQGNQSNWVASIFFFGQLAFEFPTIRLIQMFPLAKYVAVNVPILALSWLVWRRVSYESLLACRFLL